MTAFTLSTRVVSEMAILQHSRPGQALRLWLLAITSHRDVTLFTDSTRSFVFP